MDFATRLQKWLTRHPLKSPADLGPTQYTREVMARVKALETTLAPSRTLPRLRPGWVWPRLAVGLVGAAALLVVVGIRPGQDRQLAERVTRDSAILASLGESVSEVLPEEDAVEFEALEGEGMILAEAGPDDAAWVAQTLKLLDQLDEELPEDATGDAGGSGSENEWLHELQRLDETDLASTS